jgi:hypothetical protein
LQPSPIRFSLICRDCVVGRQPSQRLHATIDADRARFTTRVVALRLDQNRGEELTGAPTYGHGTQVTPDEPSACRMRMRPRAFAIRRRPQTSNFLFSRIARNYRIPASD